MERPLVMMIAADVALRGRVSGFLEREGFDVRVAPNLSKADEQVHGDCRVILLEESLPGASAVANVNSLRRQQSQAAIILLTDQSTRLSTIELLGNQISAYHSKPLDMAALANSIRQSLQPHQTQVGPATPAPPAPVRYRPSPPACGPILPRHCVFLGDTPAIKAVRAQIEEVADTNLTVLVRGESGVGKGVIARMIHERSHRRGANALATINCPAIPEALMESELFGHEAGAFTGAHTVKPGRIELANGGSAFLDEIAEIPPTMQVKLLQVIETKELHHLGGKRAIHVDVRFLAATNAKLEPMIANGQFRADLFYRLNEFPIYLPPLRERIEDIPLLAEHFLRICAARLDRQPPAMGNDSLAAMMQYHWPGNVREMEMVIHRYVLSGREETILQALGQRASSAEPGRGPGSQSLLNRKEVQMIMAVLLQTHWNQRKAAKVLGISYSALRRRIAKFGLKRQSSVNIHAGENDDSVELTISTRF